MTPRISQRFSWWGLLSGEDTAGDATSPLRARDRTWRVIMAGMATTAPGSRTLPDTSHFRRQAFIDGAFVDAASGATFACVSPVSGETLFDVAACDGEDVDRAVAVARRTFEAGTWSRLAPRERRTVLLRLADLIERDRDRLALMITLDMGKPISGAQGEVDGAVGVLPLLRRGGRQGLRRGRADRAVGVHARHARGDRRGRARGAVELPDPDADVEAGARRWRRATRSSSSPPSSRRSSRSRSPSWPPRRACPTACSTSSPGFGETAGQALGRHMDVDKLAFTGSSEVGKLFLVYAGESNMKSVQLECGGKSPNVVFDDVPDVDLAVAQAAEGIFGNSGQVCSAGSRLLLQESIADEVLEKLAAEAGQVAAGRPARPGHADGLDGRRDADGPRARLHRHRRRRGRRAAGWAAPARARRAAASTSSRRSSPAPATTCGSRRRRSSARS